MVITGENHGEMLDMLGTFFATLFGFKRSRMLNIEMMNRMLKCDDDYVIHGNDFGPEKTNADILWTVINQQIELYCFYCTTNVQV